MKQDFRKLWKDLANKKSNTARHAIQYVILKAMSANGGDKPAIAKHIARKTFTAITNPNKLANGMTPFHVLSPWVRNVKIMSHNTQILGVNAGDLLSDEEIELFNNIYSKITPDKLIRRYSYFFSRQDYFEEYQLVQTAHAALQLGSQLTPNEVKDLHFTCCGVEDLEALENVERVLQSMKVNYEVFREPDIGNQKTAIGVYPIEEHRRGLLKNYKLLRFQPRMVGQEVW